MTMKYIIILLLLIPPIVSASVDTYDYSMEKHCNGNMCGMTIYPDVRFVPEDTVWKIIEDAKSLKKFITISMTKDDGIHGIEVVDFNYTCIS